MYTLFSRYYDLIFPPRPAQVAFLRELVDRTHARRLLDAGCATGGYCAVAADWGLEVTGVDLDPAMIAAARARGVRARFEVADIACLPYAAGSFDLVICLGNTLAHLLDEDSLHRALASFHRVLDPAGTAALQLVNYERVQPNPEFAFPVLVSSDGNVTFHRRYRRRSDGLLDFLTSLKTAEVSHDGHSVLRPWYWRELGRALEVAGFSRSRPYGSFEREPYTAASPALVVETAV